MSEFNTKLTQAYQIIRGRNLLTLLVIPNIFDLDSFFSKRRLRALIYVYQRGRFAIWGRDRLRALVDINQHFYIKNYWVVPPTYSGGYFPKYKGMLAKPYHELKEKSMQQTLKDLLHSKKNPKKVPKNDG